MKRPGTRKEERKINNNDASDTQRGEEM